jgi:putative hydrolase of the HAD superfamily
MEKFKIIALILDYGGVVSQPQNLENVRNILRCLGQEFDDFMQVYYDLRAGYDNGQLSGQQYWAKVLQHYDLEPNGFDLSYLVQEDVNSWTQLNQSMLRFITENRNRIPKLAMISNMVEDTLVLMRRRYDWLDLFDELVFSCELGVNKPEREIYEVCLRRLDVDPNECLFVDDSAKNVQGAIEVGMHTIQFENFPQFMLELDQKYSLFR